MKRIFFPLIIACSAALVTLPFEHSLSAQESSQAVTQQHNRLGLSPLIGKRAFLEDVQKLQGEEKTDKKCKGPTGPRGHRGLQGPTGPTGPKGHSGVSTVYGSFFTEEAATVDPLDPIIFTSKSFASEDVFLEPNGVIRLRRKGDYLVVFGVSQDAPVDARVILTLNGNPVQGTNVTLPGSVPDQLTTVARTVRVTETPGRLQVVNNGGSSFDIGTDQGFDVSAFITVERLHKVPLQCQ